MARQNSPKENIDAVCRDNDGHTLAIEHTLIEPFAGEKADAARFMRTLASLEDHPGLRQPGFMFLVSQPVHSIPTGINWSDIPKELSGRLKSILPTLAEGNSTVTIQTEKWGALRLHIQKLRLGPEYPGKFLTAALVRAIRDQNSSFTRSGRKSQSCWHMRPKRKYYC